MILLTVVVVSSHYGGEPSALLAVAGCVEVLVEVAYGTWRACIWKGL